MIRIRTGSRLHFGLFSLPSESETAWLNQEGEATIPRRQFGGVGLMIDEPGVELTVEPAKAWTCRGPLAERALQFAQTYCQSVGIKDAFQLSVESAPPEHAGLGLGTQLGLCVARALAELTNRRPCDAETLARHVGRGLRSALGVHGFERGGFLIEGGKVAGGALSPLLIRQEFPDWPILLITPRGEVGVHGSRERDVFSELMKQPPDERTADCLCRLVLLGMAPALAESDRTAFGEALYDFNRRAGALFKGAQGGVYAHPRVEKIVKLIRDFGVTGVGQSSWGPTVFAFPSDDEVGPLRDWLMLKQGIAKEEINVTRVCNRGAQSGK